MLDMEFRILYWLQELRSPALDQAMEAITHLGDKGLILPSFGDSPLCHVFPPSSL